MLYYAQGAVLCFRFFFYLIFIDFDFWFLNIGN